MNVCDCIKRHASKELAAMSNEEIYIALLKMINELSGELPTPKSKKKLYYISAEFLVGKLLSSNLINLGIYDEVALILSENGKKLSDIEELESEPSLGNGGLGRLAACFLDSIATLGLSGDGIGLLYHFGLFRQVFKNNKQQEEPNPWIKNNGFLKETDVSFKVDFAGFCVNAKKYELDILGYGGVKNVLHLFDIDTISSSIVADGIDFDKGNIKKNLTLFLYPDDSDDKGKLLRIYQEYFMVSAGAQLILDECEKRGSTLYNLPDYAIIQINDTHPSMIIPELIRLLIKRGVLMDKAIEIVTKCCAYTNHTILAEALEKWPVRELEKVAPQIIPIIEILDDRVRRKFENERVSIIDRSDIVHMAHMDIHYSKSINGVAELHTEILKNSELLDFYALYPEKFNNKTNGITFRRWLFSCNPELTHFIASLIGDGFKQRSEELLALQDFMDDDAVLSQLCKIKQNNKRILSSYLEKKQGIKICDTAIFDMQIKRLHEYKRQQMNALYVIYKYLEIKRGKIPKTPICVIFGAKAAPAYTIAKDIIHLILCLCELIRKDSDVQKHLQVVMVENYNVTLAEKLIPACDISEQISLASKEASGTSNMKFILNGGVILGTEDGANVEIHKLVGDDAIYIFGDKSEEVIKRYEDKSYIASSYYEKDPIIRECVDFITSKPMLACGDEKALTRLQNELIKKDWFMTFPDFKSYIETKERAFSDFSDRNNWAKKMLKNISCAGFFSSDRTIAEYNKDIWHL